MEVEHDDDFVYTCDEITVVENVDEIEERRQKEGALNIDACHTFYPNAQTLLANQYPIKLLLSDYPLEEKGATKEYASVEHYFQSQKFVGPNNDLAESLRATSIEDVSIGGEYGDDPRDDWEAIRSDVLLVALRAKFISSQSGSAEESKKFAQDLLSTGDKTIVLLDSASNTWQGMNGNSGTLQGGNGVGRALMVVREELRKK